MLGFSNEAVITIGTLFLVIGAVEKSHVVDWMARKTFGADGPLWLGKGRMYISCFILSIFFNNTPLVAILLPVVKDWGRMRGVAASQLLIPLSYSVLSGSFISMIGTSTNLTIQGLVQADRNFAFPFFAPAPIGIVCFVALLCYMSLAAPWLLPNNRSGMLRQARDQVKDHVCEVYVSEHSTAIGKSLGDMMNSLGIAPSFAVKIRRRGEATATSDSAKLASPVIKKSEDQPSSIAKAVLPVETGTATAAGGGMKASSSVGDFMSGLGSLLDRDYLSNRGAFWYQTDLPERIEYSPANCDDTERNENKSSLIADDSAHTTTHCAFHDIVAPSYREIILPHDVVFIASAEDAVRKFMKSILGESRGLYVLTSNVLALPGFGTELVELVLSDSNPFLGKRVADISAPFAEKYHAGLITVRPKLFGFTEDDNAAAKKDDASSASSIAAAAASDDGLSSVTSRARIAVPTNDSDDYQIGGDIEMAPTTTAANGQQQRRKSSSTTPAVTSNSQDMAAFHASVEANRKMYKDTLISEHFLGYGDTILCVTSEKDLVDLKASRDFFVVSSVGELPQPLDCYKLIPVLIFIVMLILVACELIEMSPAALTVTAVFFMGKWILPEDIPKLVDIRLLMLMGTSLSFAKAMTKSGLALTIAGGINDANPSNFGALLLVYAVTLIITELISNNAAAALMYPIAVALADELAVSYKTFAMAVLVASTAGFMSPIGYQTHVMVWGPGGYKFRDFLIFGFIPDITYWILGCAMCTVIYPF